MSLRGAEIHIHTTQTLGHGPLEHGGVYRTRQPYRELCEQANGALLIPGFDQDQRNTAAQ